MELDIEHGAGRIVKLILALGVAGTIVAARMGGFQDAAPFLVGAGAAYFNFRIMERAVNKLARLAAGGEQKGAKASGLLLFAQFAIFAIGAFVILRLSGFNVAVALWGFLACPAAVLIEIFYELLTYEHT